MPRACRACLDNPDTLAEPGSLRSCTSCLLAQPHGRWVHVGPPITAPGNCIPKLCQSGQYEWLLRLKKPDPSHSLLGSVFQKGLGP